ncbi:MAG: N-succinylarginine dihydrolase [Chlamydiia bacterium]|nr:N-succinylarginine dihydrolase [Chlamydiia bacterium]
MKDIQLDSLCGPTHNFAGLGRGNPPSASHFHLPSNPKKGALEGLYKMKQVADLGIPQAVFPPHPRPNFGMLHSLGFVGMDAEVIRNAAKRAPHILAASYSAAAMWMANSATFTPSLDALDGRAHVSLTNLASSLHRHEEWKSHYHFFERFLPKRTPFALHTPLPSTMDFRDEGSANHIRFSSSKGGVHLFVYGEGKKQRPNVFIARQTLNAQEAVARRHHLDPKACLFVQQNPYAVDQGVFHNDLIAFGKNNLFVTHQHAFLDQKKVLSILEKKIEKICQCELSLFEIKESEFSLEEAIKTYFFNSQLIKLPDAAGFALLVPQAAFVHPKVKKILERLPITKVISTPVFESLMGGGGPACLRLELSFTPEELALTNSHFYLNDFLYEKLVKWIETYYREQIKWEDLADFALVEEGRAALAALRAILTLEDREETIKI